MYQYFLQDSLLHRKALREWKFRMFDCKIRFPRTLCESTWMMEQVSQGPARPWVVSLLVPPKVQPWSTMVTTLTTTNAAVEITNSTENNEKKRGPKWRLLTGLHRLAILHLFSIHLNPLGPHVNWRQALPVWGMCTHDQSQMLPKAVLAMLSHLVTLTFPQSRWWRTMKTFKDLP